MCLSFPLWPITRIDLQIAVGTGYHIDTPGQPLQACMHAFHVSSNLQIWPELSVQLKKEKPSVNG